MEDNNRVVIDYTNRDYLSLRSALVGLAEGYMPEWKTVGEPGDFGTLLLELFAYTGDVMNYYIDRMVSEAFLTTAVRRQSVLFIADMLGYQPFGKNPALVPLTFKWEWDSGSTQVFDSKYNIVSASAEGDTVTLVLPVNTDVNVSKDQTISVTGLNEPYDGVFNVLDVTIGDDPSDPPEVSYRVYGLDGRGPLNVSGTASFTTGTVLKIPAGTGLSAGTTATGEPIRFELNFDVILDSANAQPTRPGSRSDEVAVFGYGTATEGTTVPPVSIGTSTGAVGAEFVIRPAGVFEGTVDVFTREGQQLIQWTRLSKISFGGPRQNVYTTYVDDNDYTHILFGDGIAGRVPPADAEILVGFRYGIGAAANDLGARSITEFDNDGAANRGVTVFNPRTPSGGSDVESVESMRYSIPRSETIQDRAVNLKDFEALALRVPGVTKSVAYGDTYSNVFIRIASSSESVPYSDTQVTHTRLNGTNLLLVLDQDVSTNVFPRQIVYLSGLGEDLGAVFEVTATSPQGRGVALEKASIVNAPASGPRALELVTVEPHGLVPGRIIEVSGVDETLMGNTNITVDGVYEVLSVDDVNADDGLPERRLLRVSATHVPNVFLEANPNPYVFTEDDSGSVTLLPTLTVTTPEFNALGDLTAVSNAYVTHTSAEMTDLIAAVEAYLQDRKLVGSEVYAEPVQWEDIYLRVNIHVSPRYSRRAVKNAVHARLENMFSYSNVNFGDSPTRGQVYRAILTTEGVEYAAITSLFSLTQTPIPDEVVVTNEFGEEIPTESPIGTVVERVDVDPLRLPRLARDLHESTNTQDPMVSATGGLVNT